MLRAPRVLECQLFRRDTCDRHGSGYSRHRERAVPVACWPSTIYGCSYELSLGLTTSLKTIDGDCWWGENAGASIWAWNKTCNTHLTGGVRWCTPLKRSSFIATLANPAARNSAILPVFTMCSWWKCTVFTMGVMPPFDGHMTLLTTLPTSSESGRYTPDPFPRERVGSGNETTLRRALCCSVMYVANIWASESKPKVSFIDLKVETCHVCDATCFAL